MTPELRQRINDLFHWWSEEWDADNDDPMYIAEEAMEILALLTGRKWPEGK